MSAAATTSSYADPELVAWDPSARAQWRSDYLPPSWSHRVYGYDFGERGNGYWGPSRLTRIDIGAVRAHERMR